MTQQKRCPVCGEIQPAGLDCRKCAASLIDVPFLDDSQATLVLQAGHGCEIQLKSGDVIGRETSGAGQLSGKDFEKVSRRHARVTFEGGRWVITDLDSSNGLYVDGKPVKELVLELGTEFSLSTACRFSVAKC